MLSNDIPIFQQLAAQIKDDIVAGTYADETAVPSTNEYAVFYRINPATAGKAVNLLVEQGILYKKRGVGMFVSPGAAELLLAQRRDRFTTEFLTPMLREAQTLGIGPSDLAAMIDREAVSDERH
ncbi:DNA-binding transcriptional regulator YhcF (GntR family) [Glaciihabitans tibetensis]|uniref:DNA-binding transcriptional regulator YhcF (GntR family) n=1 Tax=Glaciihabitans tibetensis TaxID=1266600 RepID=A0A2T0VIE1_9MICO|nr:GntR family transcriptional regulator [Glaciihabitans tibetensis]PRY70006.1 DNA-binding transcriptional regulator YhcF (GntR family) [Glaciihabitans tibetensis]